MLRSDPRIHYKMYKAKKNMVCAALFSFAVLGGLGLSQNAKADTVENTNVTPAVQTTVNSAQSTTGATPQSMPTQSAVPTQSSAADVNTVSPSADAQPVSAQPVVNSQDDSASNANNQTQTTTLNVQSTQPAQNSAAANLVSLYAQNLMQVQQEPVAQNVTGSFGLTHNASVPDSHDLTTGKDQSYSGSMQLDFDVNNADLKAGNKIRLGQFVSKQDSEPAHSGPGFINGGFAVRKDNQEVGRITEEGNSNLILQVTQTLNGLNTGVTHFHVVSAKGSLLGNWEFPASAYPDVNKDQVTTIQLIDPQGKVLDSAKLTYTKPTVHWFAKNTQYNTPKTYIEFVNSMNGSTNVTIIFGGNLTNEQTNQLVHSNGDGQTHYNDNYQFAFKIKKPSDNSLMFDNDIWAGPLVYLPANSNGDGQLSASGQQIYAYAHVVKQQNLGDNLSLAQLRAKTQPNTYGVSRQNDGSLLVVMNFNRDPVFKFNEDYYKDYLAKHAYDINSLPKDQQQKAVNSTINLIKDGVFDTSVSMGIGLADPTIASKLEVDLLNPETGDVINTANDTMRPSQLMASGQAAVKLHVINATNGTELNQWRKLISEARYGK